MPKRALDRTALHLDARVGLLGLTAELCRVFAEDDSEKANIKAIDAIKDSFQAASAALFYVNDSNVYRLCVAGMGFPIALPEKRWKACVVTHGDGASVSRFGPWAIPGFEASLESWISVCLYGTVDEGGYVFLGKDGSDWTDTESSALVSIKETIAPIVEIRRQRGLEKFKNAEAERRLSRNEARLRDLFEGSRDMIYTADAADSITSVNLAALTLLGYDSKDELVGKPFSAFALNPEDRALLLSKIAVDGYADDYEIVMRKADGTTIFCLETARAIRDASGAVREIQGTVRDISGRIENERKLWKMNLELAEANIKLQKTQALMVQHEKLASIGQLAAGVAHEINNPLGFLISNSQTLEKYYRKAWSALSARASHGEPAAGQLPAGLQADLADAEAIFAESRDGFNRILKIVASLKDFSRVDRTNDLDDFDLNAGIESTMVVAWNEIKYVAEVRKSLGDLPHIKARGGEINQVILNLLVNAAQAIKGSGGKALGLIDISTKRDGDSVLLSIHDDGPGIPEAVKNKVFDPFFTTKEPGKGTGLGLSISYDIVVNKHGGELWVESEPGSGTTFYISLPIAGPPG